MNRWWGTQRSTGSSTGEEVPIRFSTYNIRNGRNGGLELALRGMAQANMDLGIFQETKCTEGIYTRESAGYIVVATDAPSRHHTRVAVLYWPSPLFAVEAVRQFGPNVVSFQLATGAPGKKTHRRNLHPRVGWVHRRAHATSKIGRASCRHHRRAPVANWKLTTFGPNWRTASTVKRGDGR